MMQSLSLQGLSPRGFHRLHVTLWGEAGTQESVICAHGLTRQGRDFDALAGRLAADGLRVACPDVVGRGRSGWLRDAAGYGYPQYMADTVPLLAALAAEQVDWIGTSMGGLLGMMLAAQPDTPIRRLVINDVGPFIPKAALERIGGYLGQDWRFPDLAAAEAHLRQVHAPFGPLSDAQWRHLTEHSVAAAPDGQYRFAYDPGIAQPFPAPAASTTSTSGPSGTGSPCRPWSCAAPSPTSCWPRRPKR